MCVCVFFSSVCSDTQIPEINDCVMRCEQIGAFSSANRINMMHLWSLSFSAHNHNGGCVCVSIVLWHLYPILLVPLSLCVPMCVFVRSNNAKLCAHAHTHLSSGDALCARACACVCIRAHAAATTKTLHCHRLCGVLVCGSFTKTLSLDW